MFHCHLYFVILQQITICLPHSIDHNDVENLSKGQIAHYLLPLLGPEVKTDDMKIQVIPFHDYKGKKVRRNYKKPLAGITSLGHNTNDMPLAVILADAKYIKTLNDTSSEESDLILKGKTKIIKRPYWKSSEESYTDGKYFIKHIDRHTLSEEIRRNINYAFDDSIEESGENIKHNINIPDSHEHKHSHVNKKITADDHKNANKHVEYPKYEESKEVSVRNHDHDVSQLDNNNKSTSSDVKAIILKSSEEYRSNETEENHEYEDTPKEQHPPTTETLPTLVLASNEIDDSKQSSKEKHKHDQPHKTHFSDGHVFNASNKELNSASEESHITTDNPVDQHKNSASYYNEADHLHLEELKNNSEDNSKSGELSKIDKETEHENVNDESDVLLYHELSDNHQNNHENQEHNRKYHHDHDYQHQEKVLIHNDVVNSLGALNASDDLHTQNESHYGSHKKEPSEELDKSENHAKGQIKPKHYHLSESNEKPSVVKSHENLEKHKQDQGHEQIILHIPELSKTLAGGKHDHSYFNNILNEHHLNSNENSYYLEFSEEIPKSESDDLHKYKDVSSSIHDNIHHEKPEHSEESVVLKQNENPNFDEPENSSNSIKELPFLFYNNGYAHYTDHKKEETKEDDISSSKSNDESINNYSQDTVSSINEYENKPNNLTKEESQKEHPKVNLEDKSSQAVDWHNKPSHDTASKTSENSKEENDELVHISKTYSSPIEANSLIDYEKDASTIGFLNSNAVIKHDIKNTIDKIHSQLRKSNEKHHLQNKVTDSSEHKYVFSSRENKKTDKNAEDDDLVVQNDHHNNDLDVKKKVDDIKLEHNKKKDIEKYTQKEILDALASYVIENVSLEPNKHDRGSKSYSLSFLFSRR